MPLSAQRLWHIDTLVLSSDRQPLHVHPHMALLTRLHTRFARGCLGVVVLLAMLLSQQALWGHALSHVVLPVAHLANVADGAGTGSHPSDRGDLDHTDSCQACLAFHAGAHALHSPTLTWQPHAHSSAEHPESSPHSRPVGTEVAYLSRAPPVRC